MENRRTMGTASAVVLAVGMVGAAYVLGAAFLRSRTAERWVSVKGVAEREVKADLAFWPVRFVATGNDLKQVQQRIRGDEGKVRAFLDGQGVPPGAAEIQQFGVTDLKAQSYRSGPVEDRFIVSETLLVRLTDVDRVAAASQKVGELVAEGVVLGGEGGPAQAPTYAFTRLNEVKPAMIAEATQAARLAAEQFAADAGSRLGSIRRASQGVFQILARDEAQGIFEPSQIHKKVRVVSTVEYYLED